MKEVNIIGKEFPSNKYGNFIVMEKKFTKDTSTYYSIKFVDTDTVSLCEKRNILHGRVADCYAKTIYDVGCRGNVSSRYPKLNGVAFKRWCAMLSRCYNQNGMGYKSYGGKGCRVSADWLCFENYLMDIQEIDGFDIDDYLNGEIQLDKDTKVSGNKLYSKENCIFLQKQENQSFQPSIQKEFIAISPEKIVFQYSNANKCAKEHNLTARTILKCLHGQFSQHKGWTFQYVNKGEYKNGQNNI